MPTDPVTDRLEQVRGLIAARAGLIDCARRGGTDIPANFAGVFNAANDRLATCAPALLAAVEAVLNGHTDDPVFLTAEDCGHREPPDPGAWAEWDVDHPPGAADVGRICLMTEIGRSCPACTELVYGTEGAVGEDCVHASSCIVRHAVAAELMRERKTIG